MPSVRKCKKGCTRKESILCKHRFGGETKVIAKTPRLRKSRLPDVEVARHVFDLIGAKRTKGENSETQSLKEEVRIRTDTRTRWLLFTHDVWFWDTAYKEQEAEDDSVGHLHLTFEHNDFVPVGKKVRRGDRYIRKGPTVREKAKAKSSGLRREWISAPVNGRTAHVEIVVLPGPGEEASGTEQLKHAIDRAWTLLQERPE